MNIYPILKIFNTQYVKIQQSYKIKIKPNQIEKNWNQISKENENKFEK